MRSFGPAIKYVEGKFESASCSYCIFQTGSGSATRCTHMNHKQPIPDTTNTPDFCSMLPSGLREAAEMNARDMAKEQRR